MSKDKAKKPYLADIEMSRECHMECTTHPRRYPVLFPYHLDESDLETRELESTEWTWTKDHPCRHCNLERSIMIGGYSYAQGVFVSWSITTSPKGELSPGLEEEEDEK